MRVVFDTNVLVSGVLNEGVCRRLLSLAPQGRLVPLLGPATVAEFLRTMADPRFKLKQETAKQILAQDLLPFGEVVQPHPAKLPHPCSDPDDDKFIAAAIEGRAQFVVAGDSDLLELKAYDGIRIVSPRVFLDLLKSSR